MEKLGITKVHHYQEMIIFGVFWNQSQRFMTILRNLKTNHSVLCIINIFGVFYN